MAIRVYGATVASYNTWASITSYIISNRIAPTNFNSRCYECVTAGISGEAEPNWSTVLDSTIVDGTVVWTCKEPEIASGPLTVILDVKNCGGFSLKDIWVRATGEAEFIVYGSHNGINWRQIDELSVPHGNRDNRHKGLHNAYNFIKVSTDSITESEIEIVAESA